MAQRTPSAHPRLYIAWLTLLSLVMALAIAAVLWQLGATRWHPMNLDFAGATRSKQGAARPRTASRANRPTGTPLQDMLAGRAGAVLPLMLGPGSTPLAHEPAGLPPCPAPGATEQIRFARHTGADADEVAMWSIPSDGRTLARAASFYQHAAEERGFRLLKVASVPSPVPEAGSGEASGGGYEGERTLLMTGSGRSTASLTIRLQQRGQAVHVLLWLRYAMR